MKGAMYLKIVLELFRKSRMRKIILKRSGLRGGGSNDNGVLHGVVLLKSLDELSDGRTLLADGNVDAVKLLGLVVGVVPPLLVEDGVKSDGSLTGLTVTNDQLTLATADGNHGVDGLETSLYGLVDGVTGENTGGLLLGTTLLSGLDGTLAVDGVAEGVNDTAKKSLADGDVDLDILLVHVAGFEVRAAHTISPVRLTVSPSRTSLSEPKSTTPTWPASRFMHMPLTPEANLV